MKTPLNHPNTEVVRCVVAGKNFDSNESDFIFVSVRAKVNQKTGQYNRGKVNSAAKKWADKNFWFKSSIVFTPEDSAYTAFAKNAFDWKSATIIEDTYTDISIYKGSHLEYIGDSYYGISKGDKIHIIDTTETCFVIKTYSWLLGEVWTNYTEVPHDQFKKK